MPSESESFLGVSPEPLLRTIDPSELPLRRRLTLLIIAWLAALLMTCPDPRGVALLPLFPLGVLKFLFGSSGVPDGFLVFGWLGYALVSATIILSSRRLWCYAFYALAIALLLTNVAGCRQILHELSRIN